MPYAPHDKTTKAMMMMLEMQKGGEIEDVCLLKVNDEE